MLSYVTAELGSSHKEYSTDWVLEKQVIKRIFETMMRKYEELRTFRTKALHNFHSLPKITK